MIGKVGERVRVYWVKDDEWHEGKVVDYERKRGYHVKYDEGVEQWDDIEPQHLKVISSSSQRSTKALFFRDRETLLDMKQSWKKRERIFCLSVIILKFD